MIVFLQAVWEGIKNWKWQTSMCWLNGFAGKDASVTKSVVYVAHAVLDHKVLGRLYSGVMTKESIAKVILYHLGQENLAGRWYDS